MAFSAGSGSAVYVNGYDLSAYFSKATADGVSGVYDTTTFGKTAHVYIGGLKDGTLSAEGFFDGSASAVDAVLAAALGTSVATIWTIIVPNDAIGNRGRGFGAANNKYSIDAPVDGVVSVSVGAQSNSGFEPVVSLHPLASNGAGTTNGTDVDNAVLSSNGGTGYLHVTVEAASTATITIQHSTDGSAWVDLITFVAVTSAPNAQRIEVTGTVNRHLRSVVVATGGAITSHVSFARK